MAEQPRPTMAGVFALLEQRRSVLAAMHERMEVADDWLHADEEPSPILPYVNQGFGPEHPWSIFPYAWTVLLRGANQIHTAEVPQVTYELPTAYKKRYKNAADKEKRIQEWLQGCLYIIVTTSTENPFLDLLYQQLGLGQGCLSYALDYERWGAPPEHGRGTPEEIEAWEAFERQRSSTLPWRVESLHPCWVFFDTDHDPPLDYIIERPVSLADMARRYPKLGLDPMGSQSGSAIPTATFVEYVSPDWYGCWVNGEPVTEGDDVDDDGVAPNALKHAWYQLAWSGLGKKDRYGAWERRGVGMIQRGIGAFKALTINDNFLALIRGSFIPKYVATGSTAEEAAEATQDIDPLSPAVVALPNSITFRPMEPPPLPDALIKDMREQQTRLEQLYGPGILSGEYRSEAASKMAARQDAARAPYRAPKKAAEQAVANMLAFFLWTVKYEPDMGDGVALSWQAGKGAGQRSYSAELKPDDVVLGGKITVDFSPMTADDKAAKIEEARAKQEAGWIGAETAMKMGGEVEDVVEEFAQIAADKVMESPQYVDFLTQTAIAALQARLGPLAAPPAPAPGLAPAGPLAAPPGAPVPVGEMGPLPPGVPQEPGPPLGSEMAAMEQQRSAFRPPRPMTPAGAPGGY